MADPFIGEIRWFPYVRGAPTGWQQCDGTLLPISTYDALYALIGTTYGGDGQTNFGVPDLRGSAPIHQGSKPTLSPYVIGQKGGVESVTLTANQMGAHNHMLVVLEKTSTDTSPNGNMLAQVTDEGEGDYTYTTQGLTAGALNASTIAASGSSQPHDNCMPTLAIRPCIATAGIWPQQN
jgi:microcystin-dependent protein